MRQILRLGALAAAVGCGNRFDPPPAPLFPVVIRADSDPGVPLAGAQVIRKEQVIGTTGPDGKLGVTFQGTEGDVLEIKVQCPTGFQQPTGVLLVPLRKLSDSKPPEYTTKCPPTLRKVVVVIRAENGPYMPVVHLNQVIGRTDSSGAATFLANVQPNDQLEFTLQTSGDPAFKRHTPVDPKVQYLVQPMDEVVVLNQNFSVSKAPVVYKAPPPKPQPIKNVPTRSY